MLNQEETLTDPKVEAGTDITRVATDIKSGLAVFESRKAAVAAKVEKYSSLTIKDSADKEGYKAVKEARLDLMRERTATEKEGKLMRDPLTKTNKFISEKEKELIGVSQAEEARLKKMEEDHEAELECIKQAEIQKEMDRKQKMVDQLSAYGMPISISQLDNVTDEQFAESLAYAKEAFEKKEAERIAEEKRLADEAEAERLAKEAEAKRLQEERAELEKIKAEQEAAAKKIREEQEKLDAEKRKIEEEKQAAEEARLKEIEDKKRTEELEEAKKKAAEEARLKAIQGAKDEEEKRLESERKKKEAEERKAERQPDKVKIESYINSLVSISIADLKTEDGKHAYGIIMQEFEKFVSFAKEKAEIL